MAPPEMIAPLTTTIDRNHTIIVTLPVIKCVDAPTVAGTPVIDPSINNDYDAFRVVPSCPKSYFIVDLYGTLKADIIKADGFLPSFRTAATAAVTQGKQAATLLSPQECAAADRMLRMQYSQATQALSEIRRAYQRNQVHTISSEEDGALNRSCTAKNGRSYRFRLDQGKVEVLIGTTRVSISDPQMLAGLNEELNKKFYNPLAELPPNILGNTFSNGLRHYLPGSDH